MEVMRLTDVRICLTREIDPDDDGSSNISQTLSSWPGRSYLENSRLWNTDSGLVEPDDIPSLIETQRKLSLPVCMHELVQGWAF